MLKFFRKNNVIVSNENQQVYRRIKFTDYEMRVAINALDSQRKKMKARGEDVKDISNLILHLLDVYEGKRESYDVAAVQSRFFSAGAYN